jgi:multiple sugar transport system ATP-binding protein
MEIYARPANAFVARFVGSPAMALAPAQLTPGDGPFARVTLGDGADVETRVRRDRLPADRTLQLGLRPEMVGVVAAGSGTTDAKVELVERLGERTLVYGVLADGLEVIAQDEGNSRVQVGNKVGLRIDGVAAHLFGPDGAAFHAEAAT